MADVDGILFEGDGIGTMICARNLFALGLGKEREKEEKIVFAFGSKARLGFGLTARGVAWRPLCLNDDGLGRVVKGGNDDEAGIGDVARGAENH